MYQIRRSLDGKAWGHYVTSRRLFNPENARLLKNKSPCRGKKALLQDHSPLERLLRERRYHSTECVLFPDLFRRPVVVKFDQPHASSDGGAILLKACNERLGLTARLAKCIVDGR